MSTILSLMVISFFALSAEVDMQLECNYKTIQKFCDKLKDKEKTQLNNKSPFKFSSGKEMPPKDGIINQMVELNERPDGQKLDYYEHKRFVELHKKMKLYAHESILQGREPSDLTSEEKNLFDRVSSLEISDLKSQADLKVCTDLGYFGYNPSTHKLVVCPVMRGYPDSSLIWAMAAFTGRTLGNCMTQVQDIKFKKFDMPKIPRDQHPFQKFCSHAGPGGCESGKGLMACLKEGGFSEGTDDIDFSKGPAAEAQNFVLNALVNSKHPNLALKTGSRADLLKNDGNIKASQDLIKSNKHCYKEVSGADLDSGIQDWFGSEVTARYLEDHPIKAKTPEDYLEPMATMIDYNCRMPNADVITRKTHAPVETRFNSAIFTNPRLRKAMNCHPQKSIQKNCTVSAPFKVSVPAGTAEESDPKGGTGFQK